MTLQRDVFLNSEGDAWLRRNESAPGSRDWQTDPICRKLAELSLDGARNVLEIGCADGARLQYLAQKHGHRVAGVDPSEEAVSRAMQSGIRAIRATADSLPFDCGEFDVVIFGFCLYLCDDVDLFKIALEADRVLADPGWLLILDFEARAPLYKPYHHLNGIRSRKMDNKSMFLWHPAYTLACYEKFHHVTRRWTDSVDDWVSLASLRKCQLKP
ncbi:MAG TPA: class I SAM-dependent methyltransferase [Steroidobacteraceae bacterium]|nr:class I SAM-dependent methyltransferase [Steroidobacteraceae bacterium]